MANDLSQRNPVEILGEEFLERRRQGEDPQIEDYAERYAEHAEEIHALFPAMIAMENLKAIKSESSDRPIRLQVDRLERLGDYRIIREIGHGGMGIVYEAEQQSLHRRVAVKVFPKQAIGDSKQLQRFQREAATAGGLHHTNIVPVFGVGEQDGLHYFVMQLLDGVGLDQIIAGLTGLLPDDHDGDPMVQVFGKINQHRHHAQNDDTVAEIDDVHVVRDPVEPAFEHHSFDHRHWGRIADLGMQVAQALHYAHSNGVTHRDIKPSNLIVGNDWRVWVTDFGLAFTHDQERISRSGDVVGTLRYMSPEQLHGRPESRSDIYGLGLTLYELATRRPAFEGENRGSLIRRVSTSEPPRPRSICPEMPKDLETIILKAIARRPTDRYRTANDFAEDLRRFRNDEPICARRTGPLERLSRWSRRNPAMATMSLALLVGGVISLVAIGWNWRQAILGQQVAVREGQRAENNLALALGSMDRLLGRFESDWMAHPADPDDDDTENDSQVRFVVSNHTASILEEALEFYDKFAQQNARSPDLQRETAKAYRRAGDILERLGRFYDAESAYRRSAKTWSEQLEVSEPNPHTASETAGALNRLAYILYRTYRYDDALRELEQARSLLNTTISQFEDCELCTYELALVHTNMGRVLWRLQRPEESVQRHRRAVMLLEGLSEENPLDANYRLALARAYRHYYPIADACHDPRYSNEIREASASILEQLVKDFPEVPDYRCELSEMLTRTRGGEATPQEIAQIDRAVQLADELNRDFQAIPRYQVALARALSLQAEVRRDSDPISSLANHTRANTLLTALCDQFPEIPFYHALRAAALREFSTTLSQLGRISEAIDLMRESVSEREDYFESRPESSYAKYRMSTSLQGLAKLLEQDGQFESAEQCRSRAVEYYRRRPPLE
ncbi:MAG: serine/threonine-protein kinase [Planctomycetota bacterium]